MYASNPSIRTTVVATSAAALAVATLHAQRDDAWFNDAAFPPAVSQQAGPIAIDPDTDRLLLLRSNGTTLTWNGTALQVVSTISTPLLGTAIAASTMAGFDGVVAFGGRSGAAVALDQTLLFRNGVWARRFPTNPPPARAHASMAMLDGQPVLFGGIDGHGRELADTWVLTPLSSNGRWFEVVCSTPPPARHGAALCANGSGGLLLFGGHDGLQLRNDTWRLSRYFDWQQVATTVTPPPGAGPMSFDPDRREVIHVDPVSRATFRFDLDRSDWQLLAGPTLSQPFAATTSGAPCYMAYDPQRREHVFVDAAAGLSIFRVAGATVRLRQPAECTPHLDLDLVYGSPRLGGTYLLQVRGAAMGAPVWLGAGTRTLPVPFVLPVSRCLAFLADWLTLLPQTAGPDGTAWFAMPVPDDPNLIGFELDHQAVELWTQGVTGDLVARIARA